MLWIELCEGKDKMRAKPFSQDFGATAACVMRGVVSSRNILPLPLAGESSPRLHPEGNEEHKRLFLGDSWFGSVKAVAYVDQSINHACMVIKTGHSRAPKKFLEERTEKNPGGTWNTLEGRCC